MRIDSKVDDHFMRGTEESRLEPVTRLFQNTKKIRLEDTNQGDFTRSKETGMGSLSAKAWSSMTYVKESDGIEMTCGMNLSEHITKKPKLLLIKRGY